MNTFQLQCFLTVAETLNFAQAAARLSVTQPAVTHQIKALESELNVTLFKRNTHAVEITHAGFLFLEDARTIITASSRAVKRFENFHEYDLQLFSIGYLNDGLPRCLQEVLGKFSVLYPNIHPVLREAPSQSLLYRFLENETADVLWGIEEQNAGKIPGIYKEMIQTPLVCVCQGTHPLADRSYVTLADLKKERLIVFDPGNSLFFIAKFQGQLIQERHPKDIYFCESTEAALMLASAGYGIFLLPKLLLPPESLLKAIPLKDAAPLSFGVYYKTLQRNKPLKSFVDLVKEQFPLTSITSSGKNASPRPT